MSKAICSVCNRDMVIDEIVSERYVIDAIGNVQHPNCHDATVVPVEEQQPHVESEPQPLAGP